MGRLCGKDSRGEADGRAGGGLMPGLVMEDIAVAVRQDLEEAGEGGKSAHIEAIPDVSGFFPKAVRIEPGKVFEEILVVCPGLIFHGRGWQVMAEFGADVREVDPGHDEGILLRFLKERS